MPPLFHRVATLLEATASVAQSARARLKSGGTPPHSKGFARSHSTP
jgi:hypothetical protein